MVVADIDPGSGYNTHLLSRIVKNNGKVICILNTHGGGALNASINPGTDFINGLEMVVNGSTAGLDNLGHVGGASGASEGSSDVFAF